MINIDNTQNNTMGGMWSARVIAGPTQNPVVKVERVAAGLVTAGQQISVSFDMQGTLVDAVL